MQGARHLPTINNESYNYRHYKNFGHKDEKESTKTKIWYSVLVVLAAIPLIDFRWLVPKSC